MSTKIDRQLCRQDSDCGCPTCTLVKELGIDRASEPENLAAGYLAELVTAPFADYEYKMQGNDIRLVLSLFSSLRSGLETGRVINMGSYQLADVADAARGRMFVFGDYREALQFAALFDRSFGPMGSSCYSGWRVLIECTRNLPFNAQLGRLMRELDQAEQAVIDDFGEETAATGGVYEVWQNMLRHPYAATGETVSDAVIAEAARMRGVTL